MEAIPRPSVLDADELLLTCHEPADDVTDVVRRMSAYGQQLWEQLDGVRRYLVETTADGRAQPVDPDDQDGWRRWQDEVAEIGAVLAGPRGDGGHAAGEAEHLARTHRSA